MSAMTTETTARRIPGDPVPCERCGATILWAVTLAGPGGRGGKLMPIDPIENAYGNTAVSPVRPGRLVARVLRKDETHDHPVEYLAVPHFATCLRRGGG